MLGWGLADFFAKLTIDKVGDLVSLVWAHVFGTLLLLTVALGRWAAVGEGIAVPSSASAWAGLALFGVLQAVVYLLVYRGFGKGQVAVLNPVFASFSGLVAVVSIMALGETASAYKVAALALIFAGILLLSIDRHALGIRIASTPGFKEVALAAVCAAFWTVGWDRLVAGQDWVTYALLMYAFMTAAVYVFAMIGRVDLGSVAPGVWRLLVLIGAGETLAYLAISLGYANTALTSVVALLSGAFSLPTIVLARVFLRERVGALQTVGSLVVVGGVMVLAAQ
jgi:uncharacterized membrane protein